MDSDAISRYRIDKIDGPAQRKLKAVRAESLKMRRSRCWRYGRSASARQQRASREQLQGKAIDCVPSLTLPLLALIHVRSLSTHARAQAESIPWGIRNPGKRETSNPPRSSLCLSSNSFAAPALTSQQPQRYDQSPPYRGGSYSCPYSRTAPSSG